jgi:biopolymer transport protein ExbD
MDRKTLDDTIDIVLESEPDLPFVISAEQKVDYTEVLSFINGLRERGIKKVGLMVKSTPG